MTRDTPDQMTNFVIRIFTSRNCAAGGLPGCGGGPER
jgi:hypothetical protein